MKKLFYFIFLISGTLPLSSAFGQGLYFPPVTGKDWEKTAPESLKWCTEAIPPFYDFLERNNTKAVLVLKNGKIVLEKYFGTFTADSNWYWASASKTLTAFAVGLAQEEQKLNINRPSSDYQGTSWTSCSAEDESLITVRHQLTMTGGFDEKVPDLFCTLKECLKCKYPPGSRWYYHNAPYTLLDEVIEKATGMPLNTYLTQKVAQPAGMNGRFIRQGYNNVYFSTPRSMARFGLLILNNGKWADRPIMKDTAYFRQMITRSQELNKSYGYLWWLNGQPSHRLPGLTLEIPGPIAPDAPADMVAAMGKNGQLLYVVPSEKLLIIRMGNPPDESNVLVPSKFGNDVWKEFNKIRCKVNTTETMPESNAHLSVFPNPVSETLTVNGLTEGAEVEIITATGQTHYLKYRAEGLDVRTFPAGMYVVRSGGRSAKVMLEGK